jgi:hypothetical protein
MNSSTLKQGGKRRTTNRRRHRITRNKNVLYQTKDLLHWSKQNILKNKKKKLQILIIKIYATLVIGQTLKEK